MRHKESDRIALMVNGLQALGIAAEERPDGAVIKGGVPTGGIVESADDHRIAMAFAIAGLVAHEPIVVLDCDHVATSFPGFDALARDLGMAISVDNSDQ